jgi:hypothetical protein
LDWDPAGWRILKKSLALDSDPAILKINLCLIRKLCTVKGLHELWGGLFSSKQSQAHSRVLFLFLTVLFLTHSPYAYG